MELFLQQAQSEINAKLEELITPSLAPFATLFSAARYSLLSSGKRLRPLLVIATTESYKIPREHALTPACALELVHTYSLIHDDLPCMDNDDLRRGQPTLHKVYPEWQALLTGDYLLTYAFELLSQTPHLTSDQKIALVHTLATNAGSHGMIGGQVIDLLSENQTIPWQLLQDMHNYKTGALIGSALEFGAIIANAPQDGPTLKKAGLKIGLAFQMIDDVLDETSTSEALGKPAGSDRNNEKSTAVSLLGVDVAEQKAQELLLSAIEDIKTLSVPAPLLETLFHKMVFRKR